MFSKYVTRTKELLDIINLPHKDFLIKYLGLLLIKGKLRYSDCDDLISSLEKSLARWRARRLSYVGRVQLLNWVNYIGSKLQDKAPQEYYHEDL